MGAYGTYRKASYALRFWGEDKRYFSAFRYEIQPVSGRTHINMGGHYVLQVRVRYLGPDSPYTVSDEDIAKVCRESFWQEHGAEDIVRYLPNCGFVFTPRELGPSPKKLTEQGRYWLKHIPERTHAQFRYLELTDVMTYMNNLELETKLPVRLFSNH